MKFMEKIKTLFGGTTRRDPHTYVVDGARMLDERNGRRMGPRDQLQVLSMLDRVSQQEGIAIQAVMESDRPLREVDDGGEFGSVRVYFAPDGDALAKQMLKLCAKNKNYVLVGSGSQLERETLAQGITMMSASTFRRAFCQNGGGRSGENGGERSRHGGGRDRDGGRRRNRNRRNNRGEGKNGNRAEDAQKETSAQPKETSVNQLIDLVE